MRIWKELCTFREGLLCKTKPLISTICSTALLAVAGGDDEQSSTSVGIPPFSFSCELSGSMLSLLGTGVLLFWTGFLNWGLFTVLLGLGVDFVLFADPLGCKTPPGESVEGFWVGVVAGFFEKNPRIDD